MELDYCSRGEKETEEYLVKEDVLNSQTGRRPESAAPTAIPANPASVIGVWKYSRKRTLLKS